MKIKTKEKQTNKSIKTYLTAIILIFVLCSMTLVTIVSLSMSYSTSKKDTMQQINTGVDIVKELVEQLNENISTTSKILANMDITKNFMTDPQAVETLLEDSEELFLNIERIAIVDRNGQQVAKYPNTGYDNVQDREYFQRAIKGESLFSDVIVSRSTNKQLVIYCEPIRKDNEVIGIVMSMVNMDQYINKVKDIETSEFIKAYIVDSKGNQIINTSLTEEERAEEIASAEVINLLDFGPTDKAITDQSGDESFYYKGKHYTSGYAHIPEVEWGIIVYSLTKEALAALYRTIAILICLVAGIILLVILCVVKVAGYISKPIIYVTEKFKLLAQGEFGLVMDEEFLSRQDELGELTNAAQFLDDKIKGIITNIKGSTNVLADYAGKINLLMDNNNKKLLNTSEALENLSEESYTNLTVADASIKTLDEISQGINEVATNIQEVLDMVNISTKASETGAIQMEKTADALKDAAQNSIDIEGKMKGLQNLSTEISAFSETILNIAKQTNLLALNAAIESARAGEAGKGFAVVADEVRKLADDSSYAAERITKLVGNATSEITVTSGLVNKMGDQMSHIRDEAKQRMQEMKDVTLKSQSALVAIESITAVAEEQTACVEETTGSMQTILVSMTRNTEVAKEINTTTKEQTKGLEKLKEMADELDKMSDQLNDDLAFFK